MHYFTQKPKLVSIILTGIVCGINVSLNSAAAGYKSYKWEYILIKFIENLDFLKVYKENNKI